MTNKETKIVGIIIIFLLLLSFWARTHRYVYTHMDNGTIVVRIDTWNQEACLLGPSNGHVGWIKCGR